MIDGGARVLPYGYYHASYLFAGDAGRKSRFGKQHADYVNTE
jgi:hypothetical protein